MLNVSIRAEKQLLIEIPSKMATSATKALCNYLMSKNVMHFK